jgi:hypothetical protein
MAACRTPAITGAAHRRAAGPASAMGRRNRGKAACSVGGAARYHSRRLLAVPGRVRSSSAHREANWLEVRYRVAGGAQKKSPLEYRTWRPGEPLVDGVWNIPVPKKRDAVIPDAVLAPLVGFDRQCYRLGYGGGYFDRTLASLSPRPLAIGVGFELSQIETIYPQSFDVPMDVVVTEADTRWR